MGECKFSRSSRRRYEIEHRTPYDFRNRSRSCRELSAAPEHCIRTANLGLLRHLGLLWPGRAAEMAGVTASLWGAVVLAVIAGVVAMFLPPAAATEVSWAAAKGDD